MNNTPSLVGQEISGCEILNKVAEGGMGAVYKARHKALNRIVCVKILSPALANDKKAVELFLTEARAIAELDHPNIVNVYNVGKEKGYYFIVMSYIEGQTLSMMLKRNKVLPIGIILDLFEGVLQGLSAAHEKGIIHRDIKPSNILINPQMQPKVVDFGIAKKVDKSKGSTKTTELAGTAYFIAPEQALGKDLDTRADLYSVGASMYYVLTGQFPYNGKNTIDIIQKHINDPVPNPAKIRKDMPGWLALAVQKLMSKNPDDRFQTAKETYLYFQKMRAEDQLRVKMGNSGRAIDLGEEGPLKIAKEELPTTQSITKARAQEVAARPKTTSSARLPSLMPSINAAADIPDTPKVPQREPAPQMLAAEDVKPVNVFVPAKQVRKPRAADQGLDIKGTATDVVKFILFVPLFMAFAAGIIYVFYSLGKICSVHTDLTAGFLSNLIHPFFTAQYEPNQAMMTGVAVITLLLIFASSALKAFSRSTTLLIALAAVSYMTGLFTPEAAFMDLSQVGQYLFTPEYYLCYLVLAAAWGLSLCWRINRTIGQGVLGTALLIFSMSTAFLAAHLSIPPASQNITVQVIFYAALFCGFLSAYYLLARRENSIIFPFVLMVLGIGGMWVYAVSGLTVTTNNTLTALTDHIKVAGNGNTESNARMEKLVGIKTQRQTFAELDHTNELSGKNAEETYTFLETRINRVVPGVFDEQSMPLFIHFLQQYYHGGENKMDLSVWDYAISLPLYNFNRNAQDNNAYGFLILLLYIFGTLSCVGTLLFKEEL